MFEVYLLCVFYHTEENGVQGIFPVPETVATTNESRIRRAVDRTTRVLTRDSRCRLALPRCQKVRKATEYRYKWTGVGDYRSHGQTPGSGGSAHQRFPGVRAGPPASCANTRRLDLKGAENQRCRDSASRNRAKYSTFIDWTGSSEDAAGPRRAPTPSFGPLAGPGRCRRTLPVTLSRCAVPALSNSGCQGNGKGHVDRDTNRVVGGRH